MECFDHTEDSPELNLALDEALLLEAEDGRCGESLRFWTPPRPFVVLGYSRRAAAEVRLQACTEDGIPVLRRASGGGTVLQHAGCLNYSLVLDSRDRQAASTITGTTRIVMEMHARVCADLAGDEVRWEGESDLVLRGKKFSGNAQRRLLRYVMFHGTFLLEADIPAISRYLSHPEKEPSYRRGRPHEEFLTGLHLERRRVATEIAGAWGGRNSARPLPLERARALVRERYGVRDWQLRR